MCDKRKYDNRERRKKSSGFAHAIVAICCEDGTGGTLDQNSRKQSLTGDLDNPPGESKRMRTESEAGLDRRYCGQNPDAPKTVPDREKKEPPPGDECVMCSTLSGTRRVMCKSRMKDAPKRRQTRQTRHKDPAQSDPRIGVTGNPVAGNQNANKIERKRKTVWWTSLAPESSISP